MAHLPREFYHHIQNLYRGIDRREILKSAFEPGEQPHVTVLYGFNSNDPLPVARAVKSANLPRIDLEVGGLSVFQSAKHDVLKLDVHSPDLHKLNSIVKQLPNSSTFPDYKPHITVAYLKPGAASKYAAWLNNAAQGRRIHTTSLVFQDPNKRLSVIPLAPVGPQEAVDLAMMWPGLNLFELLEMTTAGAVGLQPVQPMGTVNPVVPRGFTVKRRPGQTVKGSLRA
jgi:2'-5' RNA ligase